MKTIIYHNPRCSKSREGLCMLEDLGEDVEVRNYIKEPPTYEELDNLLQLLHAEPLDIIRKKESIFKEQYDGKTLTRRQWIEAMCAHPVLIERPIVVKGNKAVVGRPPVLIKDII
ncbi:MAG: arsenate reductase (glutaredoxin) [Saprospiraceae bacterium]|nr:arsenate reductase (glutaredoxin) [Saprospiraceae bacterium]